MRMLRSLESLSLVELSQGAKKLVSRERRHTAALIVHLAEISRRKGHLELGYASLFDYCQRHLGLGKYSVWNRTQVANVSRRFPQLLESLIEGKVTLSSLGVLAPHLSEENIDELLGEAEGKTKEEVKEIVAALRPKPAVKPSIRRKPERKRVVAVESHKKKVPASRLHLPETREETREPVVLRGEVEAARPEVYNFRFSGGKELKEKLERLAEVLGIENATKPHAGAHRQGARSRAREEGPEAEARAAEEAGEHPFLGAQATRLHLRGVPPPLGAQASRLHLLLRLRLVRTRGPVSPDTSRAPSVSAVLERAAYQCEYTGPRRCALRGTRLVSRSTT